MKISSCIGILSLVAAGLMSAGAALAQAGPTHIFTVPVEVSEVHPDVPAVRVYCYLRHSSGYAIVSGYADIPLDSNRAYSGIVTIDIPVNDISLLDSVEDWSCNIQHQGSYNSWMSSHQDPNGAVEYFHVNGDGSYEHVGEY